MPFIEIRTNQSHEPERVGRLLSGVTQVVHDIKGDPVAMISCMVHAGVSLAFGGEQKPCAIVHMTATGFTEELTAELTRTFTALIGETFGVSPERMYVFFREITPDERHFVGWNGKTFKEWRPTL